MIWWTWTILAGIGALCLVFSFIVGIIAISAMRGRNDLDHFNNPREHYKFRNITSLPRR